MGADAPPMGFATLYPSYATDALRSRRARPRHTPVPRLAGALRHVSAAVDRLQVRQAPKSEQRRPRRVAMLAPDLKQRHAMVDLGGLPQAPATLAATARLQAAQQTRFAARRVPELPGDHAGAVPGGVLVRAAAPQIDMPAETENRLTADAAIAGTPRVFGFAIGRGRNAECRRQSALAIAAQAPDPSVGRAALCRERPRQPIGAQRMRAPIGIDRQSGVGGTNERLSARANTTDG